MRDLSMAAACLMAGFASLIPPNAGAQQAAPASAWCGPVAQRIGGVAIPSGPVCDVVVVRKSPIIRGHDGMNLNQFTLMNSVLEFMKTGPSANDVYVMGDFALLETELNGVLALIKQYGWTETGNHNHMIMETPKTTFIHWETRGDLGTVIGQINQAFNRTSIK